MLALARQLHAAFVPDVIVAQKNMHRKIFVMTNNIRTVDLSTLWAPNVSSLYKCLRNSSNCKQNQGLASTFLGVCSSASKFRDFLQKKFSPRGEETCAFRFRIRCPEIGLKFRRKYVSCWSILPNKFWWWWQNTVVVHTRKSTTLWWWHKSPLFGLCSGQKYSSWDRGDNYTGGATTHSGTINGVKGQCRDC